MYSSSMTTATRHLRQDLVGRCIAAAATHASPDDPKEARAIAAFLRTGDRDSKDTIPEGDTLEWMRGAQAKKQRRIAALRHLFTLLASHLPPHARAVPTVTAEAVRDLVRPMVEGLVQQDWQEVALNELSHRVFVLNHATTISAMEAEISTTWIGEASRVLWLHFADYGLAPRGIKLGMDGVSAGTYAHVRPSAQKRADPYCDVVIHEAAHLLHYLKPENFGLTVKRGQERFVDVRFDSRELFAYACEAYDSVTRIGDRKERLRFAGLMSKDGSSFPKNGRERIAELVLAAASARNGWKVIREAVAEQRSK